MDDELIGNVLDDRYLITELLGAGAMGRVYLGRHVFLERKAAIKVMSRNLVGDADALVRFNRTASSASAIMSEHVAQIYDFGETPTGLVYLAMEFVPGTTLTAILVSDGPLAPTRVATLTLQAAEALDAAHNAGIVHRDLKPDNIMVCRDPATGREIVKLVDFGIAKAIAESAGTGVTRTGFVIGTPEFMSPEQLAGVTIDRRSDVYALGLVVFKMLTGTLPFPGNTPEETIFSRLSNVPRSLADMRANVNWPPHLQDVMNTVLARDAAKRYATAGEFADALRDAVTPGGTAERISSTLPTPLGAPTVPAAPTAPVPSAPAHPTPPPAWRMPVILGAVAVVLVAVVGYAVSQVISGDGGTVVQRSDSVRLADSTRPNDTTARADTPKTVVATDTTSSNNPKSDSARGGSTQSTGTRDHGSRVAADRAMVTRYWNQLQDIITDVDAAVPRRALADLHTVIPRLTTREDSAQAKLTQVFAYVHLDQLEAACRIVRELTVLSEGTRFRDRVRFFEANGNCG
jgi:eukaryotic-like serine/threonine-protein kinase